MTYFGSEEHQPVTWIRGHPVYAAHFVVGAFVLTMIVTSILMLAHQEVVGAWLAFSSGSVIRGEVWRLVTYGLWNPPSLWFAIDMLMLVWFGREVEKFFGRDKFLLLYGCVYVLPALLFTLLSPWLNVSFTGETGAFAIFIAFAALYPNVPILFSLLAKWVAAILVGIYTLMALSTRSWDSLLILWSTTAFAILFVRYQGGHFTLPSFRLPRRRPKLKVLKTPPPAPVGKQPSGSMAEVDALLDKIAQSGISSLTASERAKLDAARRELKRRTGP